MSHSAEIPKFFQLFQPVLDALRELGGSGRAAEVVEVIADRLSLSDEAIAIATEAGNPLLNARVQWARLYLSKTGYLDSSQRGVWALTEKGARATISEEDAERIKREVRSESQKKQQDTPTVADPKDVEDEVSGESDDHRAELRRILHELPPDGFERLCQRLLRESGFEEVEVTGSSGDGGIDGYGVLQVNEFVSFRVMFQCKRYRGTVGPNFIRDFRGAIEGRAEKGILMTTGTFTRDAKKEAVRPGARQIELVDGEDLLDLFESKQLGVNPRQTYDVDLAFFEPYQS